MHRKFAIFLQLLFWTATVVIYVSAECNVCQTNMVACINSTSFYLCFGGTTPNTDVLYHCKTGFECTSYDAICLQASSTRPPSCGDTSLCGLCSAHVSNLFACQSRTTFQMCYGAVRPTGQIGYCPDGYLCDASSDAVCVPENDVDTITCDIVSTNPDDSTTSSSTESTSSTGSSTGSSTESTTLPTTETLTPDEVCARINRSGLTAPVPSDPNCLSYIYCAYKSGVLKGTAVTCPINSYYNVESRSCTKTKPSYCL